MGTLMLAVIYVGWFCPRDVYSVRFPASPRPLMLLAEYQLSLQTQEKLDRAKADKARINGPEDALNPWQSPMKIFIDIVKDHQTHHDVQPHLWLLTYTGDDITAALVIIFILFPFLFVYFVTNFLIRPSKPHLNFKRNPEFPIIPLVYLQETKAEQRIIRIKRNSVEYICNRYLIMASDNIVDLKTMNYNHEELKIKNRKKHQPWFLLRVLAKFNALYTRNRIGSVLPKPNIDIEKGETEDKKDADQEEAPHGHHHHGHHGKHHKDEDAEQGDPQGKTTQLQRLRRIREHEKDVENTEQQASEERMRKQMELLLAKDKEQKYRISYDEAGMRKYKHSHRHRHRREGKGKEKENEEQHRKNKHHRTSMEAFYEGIRRAYKDPLDKYKSEDIRRLSTISIDKRIPNKKKHRKSAADHPHHRVIIDNEPEFPEDSKRRGSDPEGEDIRGHHHHHHEKRKSDEQAHHHHRKESWKNKDVGQPDDT